MELTNTLVRRNTRPSSKALTTSGNIARNAWLPTPRFDTDCLAGPAVSARWQLGDAQEVELNGHTFRTRGIRLCWTPQEDAA